MATKLLSHPIFLVAYFNAGKTADTVVTTFDNFVVNRGMFKNARKEIRDVFKKTR